MKRFAALFLLVPSLLFAAGTENEKFVWKDCPSDIRVHAIREFMEIVQRDDLVVYSTAPGKLSGVCGRAKVPELKAKLASQAASAAKSAAAAAAAAKSAAARARAADPSAEQVYSFSLAELLDPDRELWLVRRLVPADRRAGSDLEEGSDAVVFFGGTDKQGSLVVGQKLRGVLVPRGVHTVTNDYRREVFGGDGWERRRHVERLRRFHWRADRAERPAAEEEEPGAPAAPPVYFRTFGINYLNADRVFPLWLRARGGSFKTSVKAQKTCDKCGGRGRWTEWKGSVQQPVVCPACGGNGSVEITKTYEFVPEGPNARKKVPFK